jgi:hypothetical protein
MILDSRNNALGLCPDERRQHGAHCFATLLRCRRLQRVVLSPVFDAVARNISACAVALQLEPTASASPEDISFQCHLCQ